MFIVVVKAEIRTTLLENLILLLHFLWHLLDALVVSIVTDAL